MQRKAGEKLGVHRDDVGKGEKKPPLVPKNAPMTHGGEGGTKGTFSRAASRNDMGVQEYASKVLNDPKASPELKKKANFARNASKWGK
jgi:hypothetical protein